MYVAKVFEAKNKANLQEKINASVFIIEYLLLKVDGA